MDFDQVIKSRYSCKKFSNKKLEENKLNKILEAGRLAPTAKNLQGYHVYVLRSAEYLDKIDNITPCRYGATTVLVVTYKKDNNYIYPGGKINSGVEDATIVASHMILAAANEGVDSCWINNFDPHKLALELDLPNNQEVVMIMDLGYKEEGFLPLSNHYKRKELDELVLYL